MKSSDFSNRVRFKVAGAQSMHGMKSSWCDDVAGRRHAAMRLPTPARPAGEDKSVLVVERGSHGAAELPSGQMEPIPQPCGHGIGQTLRCRAPALDRGASGRRVVHREATPPEACPQHGHVGCPRLRCPLLGSCDELTEHALRFSGVGKLPGPRPALRRTIQLGPTRHHHTPLKSEEPVRVT